MPHPWLIRFEFSAAIALPSMSLLWLALPVRAVENPHPHLPPTANLAQPDHRVAGEVDARTAVASASVASFDDATVGTDVGHAGASLGTAHGENVHTTSSTPNSLVPRQEIPPPPFLETVSQTPAARFNNHPQNPSETISATIQIEPPQTHTLLGEANSVVWGSSISEATASSKATIPVDASIEAASALPPAQEFLPSSLFSSPSAEASVETITERSSPVAITTVNPSVSLTAAPQAVESTSSTVLFSQADPAEPSDPVEDETFSPLPEADPVDETEDTSPAEPNVPTLEPPEDLDEEAAPTDDIPTVESSEEEDEDSPEEDEDLPEEDEDEDTAPPSSGTGNAVPIPEDRVLDDLQYLDPNPNPLLIQTEPEEVEIIGQQPVTLAQAVELAYRNNPDLQIALLELEQSQAALREAQAALFPTVTLIGTLQAQNTTEQRSILSVDADGDGELDVGDQESLISFEELGAAFTGQIQVNYDLYTSGQRAASIRAAEEQVRFDELDVELIQEDLRLETATNYYNLQIAIESIRINEAFLEEAERNLRDTILREDVGVGTRFDVLRAEVQAADARQDLVNAQRDRQVSERALASQLNLPPSLTIDTVPVEVAGDWPLSLEESIVLAFQNRAELEQQLVLRDLNDQLRRAELALLGPQVDLFATYTTTEVLTDDSGFEDSYQIGAQVSWNIFEGGAARARARQRELDIEIAERSFEDARNVIRLSVEDAYFNLQSNLTNIDTARLSVEQASEALDLANLRFDAGVGTQLEILDAQSDLTDAEVNLVQAIVGYNQSLADIERAISSIPQGYYLDLPY
ncbi:MAG: TolC family protein [Cyanobacteria bacterium P01_F01_bin.86]